jgi:protein associated with RNAse G/E
MGDAQRWQTGQTIVVQEVWQGRLWSARPMRVIEDHGHALVLWCPRGTHWKTATTPPTRPRATTRAERLMTSLRLRDWVLGDFVWDVSTLVFTNAGDWHATWVSWRPSGEAWGWYINFQRPFARTAQGLQTMDLMLDITVGIDRQWHWKDQDEFDAFVAANLIDAAEAAQVLAESERVVENIEANTAPFREPWHSWRPDPHWTMPELPPNWDHIA